MTIMTRKNLFLALAFLGGLIATHAGAHGDEDHGEHEKAAPAAKAMTAGASPIETGAAQRLADGSLFVPKPVQRHLGLRHVVTKNEAVATSVTFNGKVIADPNAGGRVQAAQPGRIEAGARGWPMPGQRVAKGETLAYLRPTASSIERANQQAQLIEIDAQLEIAERKLARYEQLEGFVAASAREAARFEVESLRKRRAALAASLQGTVALTAPVAGEIGAIYVAVGQVVEARETLFEVIDPNRLAVEALAYDAAQATGLGRAFAPLPGGAVELAFVGAGRVLREQAVPLLFRVESSPAPLAIGQPLKVIAQTSRIVKGAALPSAALVKLGAGETAVWVRAGAERFILRKVTAAPLDASRIAVVAGLEDGERVVTAGASFLMQVR